MDANEFKREDRYAVIKYKKLTDQQWTLVPELLEKFDKARVDCVVVEKDWPEYHLVWAMIEHRMAGKPVPDFNLWRQADDLQQRLADAERRNAELEKNAARYIWLRDKSESVHQFYLSTPIWFTGVKFNQESVDSAIDAALNPNPEAASHD